VVSTTERASELLGCAPDELERAISAAGLEPWMTAASGQGAYRWPELCEAAAAAGIEVPRTRPTMAAWRTRKAAKARAAKRKAGPP
jgi:hypothetical protein